MDNSSKILYRLKQRPTAYSLPVGNGLMKLSSQDLFSLSKKTYAFFLNNDSNPVQNKVGFVKLGKI